MKPDKSATNSNGNANGSYSIKDFKPRSHYSEAERAKIEAGRAVLNVIERQKNKQKKTTRS